MRLAGAEPKVVSTFRIDDYEIPDGLEVEQEIDPEDAAPLDGVNGLIVPGGGDIDPAWYGRDPHPRTHNVVHRRDLFERTLLDEALRRDVPVLAICHGMQLLNVHLGGTLDQHLADRHRLIEHDRDRPRGEPVHELRVKPGSILERILQTQRADVNSHHHQGLGVVPPVLEEIGWAEDGVLEAVASRDHTWVVGVQWHPEVMAPFDHVQRRIFDAFAEAAARHRARSCVDARPA